VYTDNRAFLIDKAGNEKGNSLATLKCVDVGCAYEGFAVFMVERGKDDYRYGYLDTNGAIHSEPRFARADRFSEGLAAVDPAAENGVISIRLENLLLSLSFGRLDASQRAPTFPQEFIE